MSYFSGYVIKLVAQRDFDLNLHIDAEFALRDAGCCDTKKILHDPTNDNFSGFFLDFINKKTDLK